MCYSDFWSVQLSINAYCPEKTDKPRSLCINGVRKIDHSDNEDSDLYLKFFAVFSGFGRKAGKKRA